MNKDAISIEKEDLDVRINGLTRYLWAQTGTHREVSTEEFHVLQHQLKCMEEYSRCLAQRLEFAND